MRTSTFPANTTTGQLSFPSSHINNSLRNISKKSLLSLHKNSPTHHQSHTRRLTITISIFCQPFDRLCRLQLPSSPLDTERVKLYSSPRCLCSTTNNQINPTTFNMSSYNDSAAYPVIGSTEGLTTGSNAGNTFTNGEVRSFFLPQNSFLY